MKDQGQRKRLLTASLLHTAGVWRRMVERALVAEGISAARADILIWMGRLGGGVRQVQLAEAIGHTSNAVVRLLDELSAADLIERRPDANDRRANTLWLTETGREMAERVESILDRLRDDALRDITSEEIGTVLALHEAIAAASRRMS